MLTSFGITLGMPLGFGQYIPEGYVPLFVNDPLGKKDPGMRLLNKRPLNLEAAAHLLDDPVTPESRMFVRNNGLLPDISDAASWKFKVGGEAVTNPVTFTLEDLKSRFPKYTYQLVLECGGNGRSEFYPPASGNQWTVGAVSCARWTGLRLRDLLEAVGLTDKAVYVGYHAADRHLSGDPRKEVISRGIPISKALQDETLLAYEMNGQPIPLLHGFPLRLVAGGFPASASGKWLTGISVRDRVHDGPKMGGNSYRVPCEPVAPGSAVPDEDMCIIESMPVKSLITYPRSGAMTKKRQIDIRGHAWAGEKTVSEVAYSIDYGQRWVNCHLEAPANRLAWQRFRARVNFPDAGYYEVWVRATDSEGVQQPMVVPGWNPKGYLNNACHRIAVKITA